jgi:hypothetical protein
VHAEGDAAAVPPNGPRHPRRAVPAAHVCAAIVATRGVPSARRLVTGVGARVAASGRCQQVCGGGLTAALPADQRLEHAVGCCCSRKGTPHRHRHNRGGSGGSKEQEHAARVDVPHVWYGRPGPPPHLSSWAGGRGRAGGRAAGRGAAARHWQERPPGGGRAIIGAAGHASQLLHLLRSCRLAAVLCAPVNFTL